MLLGVATSRSSAAPSPSPATGATAGAPTGNCARRTGCSSRSPPGTPRTASPSPPARGRWSPGAPGAVPDPRRARPRRPLPPRPQLRPWRATATVLRGARHPLGGDVAQGRAEVDGQRDRWGRRADVGRGRPGPAGCSAAPASGPRHPPARQLGRAAPGAAARRRPLRARARCASNSPRPACWLASGGTACGPVADPDVWLGTLLAEAARLALGWPPGRLRRHLGLRALPRLRPARLHRDPPGADLLPGPEVALYGNDLSAEALDAARARPRAGEPARPRHLLRRGDAADFGRPRPAPAWC